MPLINFGFKFYYSDFLVDSNSVPNADVTAQSFNHSYNFIQSFKYSVLHPTILKPQGLGVILTCDCNNLLKTCFCCCRCTRKLLHVPKLYVGNFYRGFKKSNNYVATMTISVMLISFELLLSFIG